LCDFLFGTIFGATFAYKLEILYNLGWTLFAKPRGHLALYGYSILILVLYWYRVRPEEKETPIDTLFTLFMSLAPYPAAQLGLFIEGTRQATDWWIGVSIALQLCIGILCRVIKEKIFGATNII